MPGFVALLLMMMRLMNVVLATCAFACAAKHQATVPPDASQQPTDAGTPRDADVQIADSAVVDSSAAEPRDAGQVRDVCSMSPAPARAPDPGAIELDPLELRSGEEVTGQVELEIVARAEHGDLTGVRLFVDGQLTAADAEAPFSLRWDTCAFADREHTLAVEAFAGDHISERAQVKVRVANGQQAPSLRGRASEARVHLQWTHCGHAEGFQVFWSREAGVDANSAAIRTERPALLHDVEHGTYFYRVAALFDGELGPLSNEVQVMSEAAEPRVCSGDQWCWDWGPPHSVSFTSIWGFSDSEVFAATSWRLLRRQSSSWTLVPPQQLNEVTFSDVWGPAPDAIWAAGNGMWFWNGNWQRAEGVPNQPIVSVWGVDTSTVWAIGWDGAFHFDGEAWQNMGSETVLSEFHLQDVWGSSPDDVWIAANGVSGQRGSLLHFNGRCWAVNTTGLSQRSAIWGAGQDDVWSVGSHGQIYHGGVKHWAAVESGTTEDLSAVHGCSSDDVWAVGGHGTVLHWDGRHWEDRSPGISTRLTSVWCASSQRAWVVGERGETLHWENGWSVPAAQHVGPLRSLAATSGGLMAVGEYNTVLRRDANGWRRAAGGFAERYPHAGLRDMHGARADDLWAVGEYGAMLHWNGQTWRALEPIVSRSLTSVHATSPTDVWAAGDQGILLHFDGVRWRPNSVGSDVIIDELWGAASNDVWAASWSGMAHWDGASWTRATMEGAPMREHVISVWGASANDVWAARSKDLLHWDGRDWSATTLGLPTTDSLRSLHGSATDDVWASAGESYARWDGTRWQLQSWGQPFNPTRIGALARDDVWMVGGTDTRHWDGVAWREYPIASVHKQGGVFGLSGEKTYTYGAEGTISAWTGQAWNLEMPAQPSSRHLGDVWVHNDDSIWVVGDYGTIRHWDGTTWNEQDSGTLAQLFAVAGTGPNDIWAGGEAGTLLHYDGVRWQAVERVTQLTIRDLWAASSDRVIAVLGDFAPGAILYNGTVIRWDGSTWRLEQTPNVPSLTGVWGSAVDDVWAVGQETILHWGGAGWSERKPPALGTLFGVWGRSSTDVWAVGIGQIWHWDGNSWLKQAAPENVALRQVLGTHDGLWAVGDDGAILRHDP